MSRTLLTLTTAALLFALASLHAPASKAQDDAGEKFFTAVVIDGLDLSSYNEKIQWAVLKAGESGAGARERRAAAAAFAERGNFFRDLAVPEFYKYALGDFRHAARFNPGDRDSKKKAKELEGIYEMLGLPVPQFGNTKSGDGHTFEVYVTRPQQIAFEPDKVFRESGDVTERAAFLYELDARAGQTVSIDVRPASGKGNAVFDLYFVEHRGRRNAFVLESGVADIELPASGKYQIRVYSKAGPSRYELKASLK